MDTDLERLEKLVAHITRLRATLELAHAELQSLAPYLTGAHQRNVQNAIEQCKRTLATKES